MEVILVEVKEGLGVVGLTQEEVLGHNPLVVHMVTLPTVLSAMMDLSVREVLGVVTQAVEEAEATTEVKISFCLHYNRCKRLNF